MRLETNCNGCKQHIRFSANAGDRMKLSKKLGENIALTCKACSKNSTYHVNRIYAVHSVFQIILSLIILFGGSILMMNLISPFEYAFVGVYSAKGILAAIGIPGMVFLTMIASQDAKIRNFNAFRI